MVAEARVHFVIQRVAGRGYALTQVRNSTLRIGRGTNAELRSENPAVALEHAVIEAEGGGYMITDRGSITGTYVNRKPVESARLSKGDIIEIGDLRIDVQLVEPGKPLFIRVIPTAVRAGGADDDEEEEPQQAAVPAKAGARVVRTKKVDYVSAYRLNRPWLTKLTLTALGLIVTLAVIGEVIRPDKQKAFMPGALSSAHARARVNNLVVAEQCSACHTPWQSVENAKCLDCHARPPHAQHEIDSPDCFACHAEHRGETKLAANAEERCAGCHADLTKHVRPEIMKASFAGGRYTFPAISKIRSFGDGHPQLVPPPDANTLRFNHQLHLAPRGIFNGQGRREVLQCEGCHRIVTTRDRSDPVAIDFESHCQRCHRLTFDARYPDAEVPHGGDTGLVYGFVLATYAGDRDILSKPPAEVRRILAARRIISPDERAVLNADQVFKKKCTVCHDIVRRGERYAAVAPVIRREWLDSAKFSHGKHTNVACDSCHAAARNSAATTDVLMPALASCTGCHARNAAGTQAASTCTTCHEYHLHTQKRVVMASSLALSGPGGLGREGRMLQGILLAVIVVLLLVVLVPVGIALFQRLRSERAAAPPAPSPAPPALPGTQKIPAIRADLPTDKVSRSSIPSVPPPAPPDATQVEQPLPTMAEGGGGTGTQMVEWYGLLKCTSGALEGQRFTIEENGLYIGRDPALSQVVIPDTKISKRHVRIVPRNGKVWAIDEGSTNGTFLAGGSGRITEVQLKRGDTLILGDNTATFVYQI